MHEVVILTFNVCTLGASGDEKGIPPAQYHAVQHSLLARGVSVAGFQETRAAHQGKLLLQRFAVLRSPAIAGHGGVALWISRRFQLVTWAPVTPRLIWALIAQGSSRYLVLSAHAPHESMGSDHLDEFYAEMQGVLTSKPADAMPLILLDSNASFPTGGLPEAPVPRIGPYAAGPAHASSRLLAFLEEFDLAPVNTWLAPTQEEDAVLDLRPTTTWLHPGGSQHQLDFLLAPREAISLFTEVRQVASLCFRHGLRRDHVAVEASFRRRGPLASSQTRNRMPPSVRRALADHLATDTGRKQFRESFHSWWLSSERDYPALVQSLANVQAELVSRLPRQPHRPWVPCGTLALIQTKNALRRVILGRAAASKRMLLWAIWQAWAWGRSVAMVDGVVAASGLFDWQASLRLEHCYNAMQKESWKNLRREKKRWLDAQCTLACGPKELNRLHALSRRLGKATAPAPLLKVDDRLAISEEDQARSWRSHWLSVMFGHCAPPPASDTLAGLQVFGERDTAFEDHMGDLDMLTSLLKAVPAHRAPGPDGLLGSVLRCAPDDLAAILAGFFREWTARPSGIPWQWSLSRVVPVFKGSGRADSQASYRPVSLMDGMAKVFLKAAHQGFDADVELLDDWQFCRPALTGICSSLAPPLLVHSFMQAGPNRAVVFCDLAKAFDCVPRNLLFGDKDSVEEIVAHRSFELVKKVYSSTVQVVEVGEAAVHFATTKGVKQGCPVASHLFVASFMLVLRRLRSCMAAAGLTVLRRGVGPESANIPHGARSAFLPSYMDDLAFGVVADDCSQLLHRLSLAIELLIRILTESGFSLNLAKSFVLVRLAPRDKGRRTEWAAKAKEAGSSATGLFTTTSGVVLPVLRRGKYLGQIVTDNGGLRGEILYRSATAKAALIKLKPLLLSTRTTKRGKLNLVKSHYWSRLLYSAAGFGVLPFAAGRSLKRAFFLPFLVMVGADTRRGDRKDWHYETLAKEFGIPPLAELVARRRLRLLMRLLAGPSEILDWVGSSWWVAVVADLSFIRAHAPALEYLPPPVLQDWGWWNQWRPYLEHSFAHLLSLLRALPWSLLGSPEVSGTTAGMGPAVVAVPAPSPPQPPDDETWHCISCSRSFGTRQGLRQHCRMKHQAGPSEVGLRLEGTRCPACHQEYHSRRRLLHHANSYSCRGVVLERPVLPPERLAAEMSAERERQRKCRRLGIADNFAELPGPPTGPTRLAKPVLRLRGKQSA